MTQRHKHADLIVAWVNGAEIQYLYHPMDGGKPWWESASQPRWDPATTYRIKPKPDKVVFGFVKNPPLKYPEGTNCVGFVDLGPLQITSCQTEVDNVKFVFDGETNKLKSVEILK